MRRSASAPADGEDLHLPSPGHPGRCAWRPSFARQAWLSRRARFLPRRLIHRSVSKLARSATLVKRGSIPAFLLARLLPLTVLDDQSAVSGHVGAAVTDAAAPCSGAFTGRDVDLGNYHRIVIR